MIKNILFIINSLGDGGAQRSLITISEGLSAFKDIQIHIAVWGTVDAKFKCPNNVIYHNLGIYNKYRNHILNSLYSINKLRGVVHKLKPEVTVAVQCGVYNKVLLSSLLSGTKLIVWEHTSMGRSLGFGGNFTRNYLYKFAYSVIVLTKKDSELVKGKYKRVVVMPNPIPFKVLDTDGERSNIVTAVGRLDAWQIKGFDILLRIWKNCVGQMSDWKLLIVGQGTVENVNYIKKMIYENNVQDSVILTGYRTDVNEILKKTKIYCLTSRVEGFPMCLVEAMSQGCACISFSVQNAVEDIINDANDGYIIKDSDESEFVSKLSELMHNENLRIELSTNALSNIRRFSSENISNNWFKFINNI